MTGTLRCSPDTGTATTFRVRNRGVWSRVTHAALFTGKTVVVFRPPPAFTPTCACPYVARYEALAKVFRLYGVDDIVCLALNDSFVLKAWEIDEQSDAITFLPDATGAFLTAMGVPPPWENAGYAAMFAARSMVVRNGLIERMFVDMPTASPSPSVSDADTMLQCLLGVPC